MEPTGAQYELAEGSQRAVVTEVGATLRSYAVGGTDVVDGFDSGQMSTGGRGQVLAPWPNRLRDGAYPWEGRTMQLPLSEPSRHNAIHGLVRWQAWVPVEHGPKEVTLRHRIHPQDGYPFMVELTIVYSLEPDGLRVRTEATNLGDGACPFGIGFHPYLRLGALVDPLTLHLPAATRLVTDERSIPVGREPTAGSDMDFRSGRPIGSARLDTAFTDLDRNPEGRAEVGLGDPDGDGPVRELTLWMGPEFTHVMVFTGDTLGPERSRRALAVEPMTCPPNALASREGLAVLEPGQSLTGQWGLSATLRSPG